MNVAVPWTALAVLLVVVGLFAPPASGRRDRPDPSDPLPGHARPGTEDGE